MSARVEVKYRIVSLSVPVHELVTVFIRLRAMGRVGLNTAAEQPELAFFSSARPMEVKICIIGDTDVGKTSLSMRYCHGEFPENSTPTIGASFLQRRVVVDTKEIALQIWDTAGQERFRSMAPMYYRGAKGAICVFDVTNKASFARVQQWLRDLKCHSDPNVVICIAGNKCDQEAAFDLAECEEVASSSGAVFVKTSALTGEGVDVIFQELSKRIADTYCNKERSVSTNSADGRVRVRDAGGGGGGKQQSCC